MSDTTSHSQCRDWRNDVTDEEWFTDKIIRARNTAIRTWLGDRDTRNGWSYDALRDEASYQTARVWDAVRQWMKEDDRDFADGSAQIIALAATSVLMQAGARYVQFRDGFATTLVLAWWAHVPCDWDSHGTDNARRLVTAARKVAPLAPWIGDDGRIHTTTTGN